MRESELCPLIKTSDKSGPRECNLVRTVRCLNCGVVWEVEDVGDSRFPISSQVGNCERCDSSAIDVIPCLKCPLEAARKERSESPAGRLLERLLDLRFVSETLRVNWDDLTTEEVMGLQILKSENDRWTKEDIDRKEEIRRHEQMVAAMKQANKQRMG